MNCQDIRLQISADLDGGLDAQESLQLQTHLQNCAECREFRVEQAQLAAWLAEVEPDVEPPQSIWLAIESQIGPDRSKSRVAARSWKNFFQIPQWGYALGVLVLALIGSVAVLRDPIDQTVLAQLDQFEMDVSGNPYLPQGFFEGDPDESRNPYDGL